MRVLQEFFSADEKKGSPQRENFEHFSPSPFFATMVEDDVTAPPPNTSGSRVFGALARPGHHTDQRAAHEVSASTMAEAAGPSLQSARSTAARPSLVQLFTFGPDPLHAALQEAIAAGMPRNVTGYDLMRLGRITFAEDSLR